jgi:hypothetical protein
LSPAHAPLSPPFQSEHSQNKICHCVYHVFSILCAIISEPIRPSAIVVIRRLLTRHQPLLRDCSDFSTASNCLGRYWVARGSDIFGCLMEHSSCCGETFRHILYSWHGSITSDMSQVFTYAGGTGQPPSPVSQVGRVASQQATTETTSDTRREFASCKRYARQWNKRNQVRFTLEW